MFIADIKRVVEQISREKGINVEVLIKALEEALRSAAKKKFGNKVDIEAQYYEETSKRVVNWIPTVRSETASAPKWMPRHLAALRPSRQSRLSFKK
jgi:hypothetical protein